MPDSKACGHCDLQLEDSLYLMVLEDETMTRGYHRLFDSTHPSLSHEYELPSKLWNG